MKKTILFLLVIFLMIGACGCGMKGQAKVDRMVNYINEKYADDKFTYESMSGGHLGSNTTKILVSSEKYPDKIIRVICTETDGTENFSDTYLNVKFEDETRAYIKGALTDTFGAECIYFSYTPADLAVKNDATSETTFKEYLESETTVINVSAMIYAESVDEAALSEAVKNAFSDAVVRGSIYFINDKETDLADTEAVKQRIGAKNYAKKLNFIKTTVNDYSKMEWVDGK